MIEESADIMERPNSVPEEITQKEQPQEPTLPQAPISQPPIPLESLMPHSLIGIPDILRRRDVSQKKAEASQAEFNLNLDRISALKVIEEGRNSTRFSQGLPPQRFPEPDSILASYSNLSEGDRKRLQAGVRRRTELNTNETYVRLEDDLRTLFVDRGKSSLEASELIQEIVDPTATSDKKGRQFGQLKKDDQAKVLENLYDTRNRLLRGNMGNYLSYLSAFKEGAFLDEDSIAKIREDFANADDKKQVEMAAETRVKALRAMDKTKRANLPRLKELEILRGKSDKSADKEMEDLEDAYSLGTFLQKERIIERVLQRKTEIALPQLEKISRLRRMIEGEVAPSAQLLDESEWEDQTPEERLQFEVSSIEELLKANLKKTRNGFESQEDVSEEEFRKEVSDLTELHEDPSLTETFETVLLLRTGSSEFSNL